MNDFMMKPDITLDMSCEEYIDKRWKLLSEDAKRLMRNDVEYITLLWNNQYYKKRCQLLENKLNELLTKEN